MNFFNKAYFMTRFVMLLLGCIIIAFAIASFRFINLGLDPYGVFVLGISNFINTSYGNTVLIANIFLFILAVLIHRGCLNLIGIGTIINMSIIGYIVDFFTDIYTAYFLVDIGFVFKIIFSIFILIIFSIGASLYIMSNLGIAPYELLSMSIIKFSNDRFQFNIVRVIQDIFALIGGFLLRSTIGINTVMIGFLAGIVIGFFNDLLKRQFIKHKW